MGFEECRCFTQIRFLDLSPIKNGEVDTPKSGFNAHARKGRDSQLFVLVYRMLRVHDGNVCRNASKREPSPTTRRNAESEWHASQRAAIPFFIALFRH